jgi:hypothetical protein
MLGLPKTAVGTLRRALAGKPKLKAKVRLTVSGALGRSSRSVKRMTLVR